MAWPLAALALLAPLTLHYLYYLATEAPVARGSFDGWIGLSIAVVGHCHLLLAVLCWRFARRVRRRSAAELGHAPARDGWVALGLVTLASLVPGVALLGIPVLLVAVTGLLFIPAMFHWASLRVRRERHALALDVG